MLLEHSRITRELNDAEHVLTGAKKRFEDIEESLNVTLKLLHNATETYAEAPDVVRRMMNQAIFEKVFVYSDDKGGVRVRRSTIAEPFASLLTANRHLSLGSGTAEPKSETLSLAFWE